MNAKVPLSLFTALLGLTLGSLGTLAAVPDISLPKPGPATFFVATNGNDEWSGQLPAPNSNKTDGPFASISAAQHAVRKLKSQAKSHPRPITVYIRNGIYFLKSPLRFTPEDSGTIHAPITYCAYPKEKPILSGGRAISDWQPTRVNGRSLWVAGLPSASTNRWLFHELWVNGQRRTLARAPNSGCFHIAGLLPQDASNSFSQPVTAFRFRQHDLRTWKGPGRPDVVLMTRWTESHLPIRSVDEQAKIVHFTVPTVFRPDGKASYCDPYYVENALALLDTPGEWFEDDVHGKLYYEPEHGESRKNTIAIAPKLTQVLQLLGNPSDADYVKYLVFRNLTFSHTEWYFSAKKLPNQVRIVGLMHGSGFGQAAVGAPAAIWGQGVRHCEFQHCAIRHVGDYGLALAGGCKDNRIIHCEISDLGAGGIKLGRTSIPKKDSEVTEDNEIRDCRIHDGGRLFPSAVGLWIGQSPNNRIIHNHIYNFCYTGISIGWTWGYGPATAGGNIVRLNQVDHIGVLTNGEGPILSDMGAIYTLGDQRSTVISQNLIHDVAAIHYGGWGIYLDEGTSHIVVESNLVYSTQGGFHQHYGKDNIVRNNIFAFGRDPQLQRTRNEPHRSFIFQHNIVYWKTGALIAGDLGKGEQATRHFVFDYNDYWHEGGGAPHFEKWSWHQWHALGEDRHSVNANPLFFDADHRDFRLKPDSPAIKLGFRPFVNELEPKWTDIR